MCRHMAGCYRVWHNIRQVCLSGDVQPSNTPAAQQSLIPRYQGIGIEAQESDLTAHKTNNKQGIGA